MSHWKLEKLVKEVQPLLTEEQLIKWVDILQFGFLSCKNG